MNKILNDWFANDNVDWERVHINLLWAAATVSIGMWLGLGVVCHG